MKKAKSLLCGALAVAMAMSFAGCSGNGGNTTSGTNTSGTSGAVEKMPQPVTLKYFLYENAAWPLKNDTDVLNKMYEKTNVKIEYIVAPASDPQAKFNTMMAGGNLPDLVYNAAQALTEYGKKGAFLDLTTILPDKMPNVYNEIQKSDFAKESLYTTDGKIYAIPRLDQDKNCIAWMIRQDWLDKLNLKRPETLNDWVNVLTQFKEKDPGKVGDKLVPLMVRGASYYGIVGPVGPSFGLNWAAYSKLKGTDKYIMNPASDNYKQTLQWVNQLYTKGLLDKEFLTCDTATWEEGITSGHVGATIDYAVRTDSFTTILQKTDKNAKFVACVPPSGPNGDRGVQAFSDALLDYSVAISKDSKNLDAAYCWLNYLYSDEGAWLNSVGIDGVTYKGTDANGNPNWTDEIKNSPNDMSVTSKYGIQQPSCPRRMTTYEYKLIYGPLTQESIQLNSPYYQMPYSAGIWTQAQADESTELTTTISPIIAEQSSKFIVGQRSFNEWDAFQAELKKAGIDRLGELFTDAMNAAATAASK